MREGQRRKSPERGPRTRTGKCRQTQGPQLERHIPCPIPCRSHQIQRARSLEQPPQSYCAQGRGQQPWHQRASTCIQQRRDGMVSEHVSPVSHRSGTDATRHSCCRSWHAASMPPTPKLDGDGRPEHLPPPHHPSSHVRADPYSFYASTGGQFTPTSILSEGWL